MLLTASWVRTAAFASPVLPPVGTTSASPSSTGSAPGRGQPAVWRYYPGRAQYVEEALPGWRGQALVDRRDGTTLVPGGAQLLDERRAAWQVYCDEVGHIG